MSHRNEAGPKPEKPSDGRKKNMLVLNVQRPADANSLASTGDHIDEEEPINPARRQQSRKGGIWFS
jgi:hypothetical protein